MVRGLANDMPKGVDLSKAKAWIVQGDSGSTGSITSSYNIKSLTRNSTGDYTVVFGIPFKDDKAVSGAGAASKIPYVGIIEGYLYTTTLLYAANLNSTRFKANLLTKHNDHVDYDSQFAAVFFGELENE